MLTDRNVRLLRVGFEIAIAGERVELRAEGQRATGSTFIADALRGAGMRPDGARREATIHVATINGLLLDYMATGDRKRVDDALDHYANRSPSDAAPVTTLSARIACCMCTTRLDVGRASPASCPARRDKRVGSAATRSPRARTADVALDSR